MKKVFSLLVTILLLGATLYYRNDIINYITANFIYKKQSSIPTSNEYTRDYDFSFVQRTDNFFPNNKKELYNVFYTILNNGEDSFTFYCGKEYKNCAKDIEEIIDPNNEILSIINNYVHPFNSYSSISVNMNNFGRITVDITKIYTKADIIIINNFVNTIYNKLANEKMTDEEKIKTFHDYIINNTAYDKIWTKEKEKKHLYKSNTAYGPLIEHVGLCGGYTDAMQLFLEKMHIKNYKISSKNHIWNYVNINNTWKHLDLTWDDPVTNTGKSILQYDYYMLDTIKLESKKDNEHTYNKEYYIEAK